MWSTQSPGKFQEGQCPPDVLKDGELVISTRYKRYEIIQRALKSSPRMLIRMRSYELGDSHTL